MLSTDYFQNKVLLKRPYLKNEWIEYVLQNPAKVEIQAEDNRIRYWAFIKEIGKYLRVVTLTDGITVHNAFPDRDFTI
ncbi:MAG: hypothetical protein A2475_02945 [Ignavibacteria bacterium RIFOXYC2_FULL_35_21]|nr:MAG: hypothetical protein A2220_14260 [Ignavibacteria bacterium RIFOXYA2_FULL_35_10]OGV22789.1 MAG: hypothetical protein A2475_02945 [Ignavibacteria bacterium RIFOXYC2_FULL_35_21]